MSSISPVSSQQVQQQALNAASGTKSKGKCDHDGDKKPQSNTVGLAATSQSKNGPGSFSLIS
jgi:hypothetical protein